MTRRALIVTVVVVAALIGAGAALAKLTVQTASADGVSATFSYTGQVGSAHGLRLQIRRFGATVFNHAVRAQVCGPQCSPGAFGAHARSVGVVQLERGAQADVVLELFSGGASCCFIDQVFSYAPTTHAYVKAEHNFGSYGAALRRLGSARSWRFQSGDDAFKYTFTDGADSGDPIQIWSFTARAFHNVTRNYPELITSDAARWLRLFKQHASNGVGLIAAWAADEELLGHDPLVQSTLKAAAAKGALRSGSSGLPSGRTFIVKLNRFLRRQGYRR